MSATAFSDRPDARLWANAGRKESRQMMLLLLPALAVIGVVLLLPLAGLLWESIYDEQGFTLKYYSAMLQDPVYLGTFALTFQVSGLVTLICVLVGYPLAYLLTLLPKRWAMVGLALVLVPFWTSVLVRTYAWLVMLQRRGLVNELLAGWGLIDAPLALAHNLTGTVIGMVHVMLPFMVLPLYAFMQRIPAELMVAASSLGGTPTFSFFRVFLPVSLPGLLAGTVLVFILSLGFYITPQLLGGGRTIFVSMLVQRNADMYLNWGAASSIAVVLLIMVGLLFWLIDRVFAVERLFGVR